MGKGKGERGEGGGGEGEEEYFTMARQTNEQQQGKIGPLSQSKLEG